MRGVGLSQRITSTCSFTQPAHTTPTSIAWPNHFSHAVRPRGPSQYGQVYQPHGSQPVVQEPQERYQEAREPRQGPAAVLQGGALTPADRAALQCTCCSPSRAVFIAAVLTLALVRPLALACAPIRGSTPLPCPPPRPPLCLLLPQPQPPLQPSPPLPPCDPRSPPTPTLNPAFHPWLDHSHAHDPPHCPVAPSPPTPAPLRLPAPPPTPLPPHPPLSARRVPPVLTPPYTYPSPMPTHLRARPFSRRWTPSSCATSASARSGWARAARLPSRDL